MRNETLILNAVAGLIILLIIWLFSTLHTAPLPGVDSPIVVLIKEGVFTPSLIQVPAGKNIRLQFLRRDAAPCAGSLLFPQLNASYRLPMNQLVEIILPALQPGEVDFFCPSGKFRGKMMVH